MRDRWFFPKHWLVFNLFRTPDWLNDRILLSLTAAAATRPDRVLKQILLVARFIFQKLNQQLQTHYVIIIVGHQIEAPSLAGIQGQSTQVDVCAGDNVLDLAVILNNQFQGGRIFL